MTAYPLTVAEREALLARTYDPRDQYEPDDAGEFSQLESDQAADRAEARDTAQREWRAR